MGYTCNTFTLFGLGTMTDIDKYNVIYRNNYDELYLAPSGLTTLYVDARATKIYSISKDDNAYCSNSGILSLIFLHKGRNNGNVRDNRPIKAIHANIRTVPLKSNIMLAPVIPGRMSVNRNENSMSTEKAPTTKGMNLR